MTVCFIALSLCMASMAYGQPINKPVPPIAKKAEEADKGKQEASTKQSVSVDLSSPVNVNVTGKLEMKGEHYYYKGDEQPSKWGEVLMAIFTGALVFATGWLAYYTRGLWTATVKLQKDAHEASKRQAAETAQALNISRDTANAATKSAEIAERSLVDLESARIRVNTPSTQAALKWGVHAGPNVTYNLTNHGRTPAHILDVRVKIVIIEHDKWPPRGTAEDFTLHDPTRNLLPGSSTEGFYVSLGRELTPTEVQGLAADPHRIYFVGRLRYKDIFRRLHTRWFSFKRFPIEGQPGQFSYAERGPDEYNEETIEPAPAAS